MLFIAGAAWLLHPVITAKTIEAERVVPDVLDTVLAHVGKLHRQLPGAVARQGRAVGGDVEKQVGPAVHAGLGTLFVVVRGDEDQLARVALGFKAFAVFIGDALGTLQLLAGGQQADAVEFGPAIELAGGQFDKVRLQLQAQLDDLRDPIDVVPMGDEVQHHRIALGFHRTGHGEFLGEGLARAGEHVVHRLVGGLEADLDMVQPGHLEIAYLLLGQADTGGDQVGVVAHVPGGFDQFGEVLANQRLAAGKAQLRGAHVPRFAEYANPFLRAQFLAVPGKIQWIGAIRALQRTAVGQFGEQPQRRPRQRLTRSRIAHGPPPETPARLRRSRVPRGNWRSIDQ
ncbi:hypothetical protein PS659_04072 [Pseudomonas fluorescens]|uniref:Uncharacterized protein n=1 Tax=Pseudomonas fluorescens TaxID=294 RepID=A0A5E6VB61_PSEFL|nr:hypothetical protein PS659_04072 [Pseudomonas fluorescens]